jgi:hypothetical protein
MVLAVRCSYSMTQAVISALWACPHLWNRVTGASSWGLLRTKWRLECEVLNTGWGRGDFPQCVKCRALLWWQHWATFSFKSSANQASRKKKNTKDFNKHTENRTKNFRCEKLLISWWSLINDETLLFTCSYSYMLLVEQQIFFSVHSGMLPLSTAARNQQIWSGWSI